MKTFTLHSRKSLERDIRQRNLSSPADCTHAAMLLCRRATYAMLCRNEADAQRAVRELEIAHGIKFTQVKIYRVNRDGVAKPEALLSAQAG